MNDNDSKLIAQLANQLAEGQVIDWPGSKQLSETEQDIIKQMQIISQVAEVHQSHLSGNVHQKSTSSSTTAIPMFNWGHLQGLALIGSGTYGQVYRAHDDTLKRDVALKLLKESHTTPLHVKTFIEEARRLAKVRHPNVLGIHGANIHNGRAGLWADLLMGMGLDEYKNQTLPFSQLQQITSQVTQGLAAIHQAGIIHGDIKPANLMQDQDGRYVITDFGAGLTLDELDWASEQMHGTPALMAPEILRGEHHGFASDIYALGATLFQLASHQYPVDTTDLISIKKAHERNQYAKLKPLRPDLPSSYCQLVQQMISPHPGDRPDAQAIIKTLYDIEAEPQRRRNLRAALTIFSLLVLGVAFSAWGFWQANHAKKEALMAQQKAETVNRFLTDMLSASAQLGGARDVRVADVLDHASEKVLNEPQQNLSLSAEINLALADSYNALRLADKAVEHAKLSVDAAKRIHAPADAPLIAAQLEWVFALENADKHEDSIALSEQIIATLEPTKGAQHPQVLAARKHIVTNYFALAQYDKAESVLNTFLTDAPNPVTAKNNFGFEILHAKTNLHYVKGQFEQAVETALLAKQWLDDYPKPQLLSQNNNLTTLGLAQTRLGMYESAVKNLKQAVETTQKLYGESHSAMVTALKNLGAAQRDGGQLEAAKESISASYALAQQLFKNEDNKETIGIGGNLANIYVDLGDTETGKALMKDNLALATELLGSNQPETLIIEYNLAELLNKQGHFKEALTYIEQTHSKKTETFGDKHPYVFLSLDNWAISLSGLNQHKQAIEKHHEAVNGMVSALGAEHPYTLLVKQHQIDILLAAGEKDQAKTLLPPLIKTMESVLGPDDPATLKYQNIAASFL